MTIKSVARFFIDRFGTLAWAYFGLMGFGLCLASFFLCIDKLDGGQWVTLCGILFGTDRLAGAWEKRS